jgi:thiol:disulfide interchange protein
MDYRPSSWLDQLVGACFGLLAAAVAIYVAVRLIEMVWVWLLLIGIIVAAVAGLLAFLRWRRQGW